MTSKNFFVEEDQRAKRLILSAGADIMLSGKMTQKLCNLVGAHFTRMLSRMSRDGFIGQDCLCKAC